jgi:predicted nucleic acid-binding protein
MTALAFVDTNVLRYARDASEGRGQVRAAAWLTRLWQERAGRTSVQVLSECYFDATRKLAPGLDPDEAWDDVVALLAWRPQQIDATLLQRARDIQRRTRLSRWDSLIVGAAHVQDCAVLLTADLRSGAAHDGVMVRDPFDPATEGAVATSTALPTATRRHRAVGRPRSNRPGVP